MPTSGTNLVNWTHVALPDNSNDPVVRVADERAVDALLDGARRARPRSPRWLWVIGLAVGTVFAAVFVVVVVRGGDPVVESSRSGPPASVARGGRGFGTGLALGLVGGIGIGLAIARYRPSHSERSRP